VCPTFVRSEMTHRTIARIVETTGRSQVDSEDARIRQGRLGRLLEPSEVADTIVFLASPAADSINGQAIVIDGGGVQA
jgi:NAD(P)-dependent dehydrogenase (short-subunit alcohol dehydrogenase family)